ncbi:hypothetical protein N7540_001559 [Penicillium herquei]|nr:hypothetical protein N7540_001559 [Penicillium herquei]
MKLKDVSVRLDFIHELLSQTFNLSKNTKVEAIAYEPDCHFKYNNFVYRISFPSPLEKDNGVFQSRPGCVPIPAGSTELIVRLTNSDAAGMKAANRVENEVAMISLAAAALEPFSSHMMCAVFMAGPGLHPNWENVSKVGSSRSSCRFGGLTFDENENIVSAPMSNTSTGPWSSYEAFFEARLKKALEEADENPYIQGWHANGVQARLEAFIEQGLSECFKPLETHHERAIIHADFTPSNLLFDPVSGCITGLIDYDFSGLGGQFCGWTGIEGREQMALKHAKLHGFPDPLPDNKEGDTGLPWEVAKAWEDALENAGCKRPMNIPGIDKVADADALLNSILPWRVTNSDILKRQADEVIRNCRDDNEKVLIQILENNGV